MIYTFDHNSMTLLVIITNDILNKIDYFSLSSDRSFIVIKCDLISFELKWIFFISFFEHEYLI